MVDRDAAVMKATLPSHRNRSKYSISMKVIGDNTMRMAI